MPTTDLTTKLAEALRLISFASMDRGARDTATEALRLYDAAKAQRCQCGLKPASECEPWEPGCGLGQDPEHVRVHEAPPKQAAEPVKAWCETCEGSGKVFEEFQIGCPSAGGTFDCPDCKGKGYRLLAAPVAQAEPLSEGRIHTIAAQDFPSCWWSRCVDLVRVVEAAHGIGQGKEADHG